MHHQLGKDAVKSTIAEGQLLSNALTDLDTGVSFPSRRHETVGRIHRGHIVGAKPANQLGRESTGTATDVGRWHRVSDITEIGEQRCHRSRESAHEPVIGLRGYRETHAWKLQGVLPRVVPNDVRLHYALPARARDPYLAGLGRHNGDGDPQLRSPGRCGGLVITGDGVASSSMLTMLCLGEIRRE